MNICESTMKHNQCRHGDAHYITPSAPLHGRACCRRYAGLKGASMKRNEVKEVHEQSVLDAFKKLLESGGDTVKVLSKPEPPDAIISINGEEVWVEITDAFITPEHARSLTSHAAEDKEWIKSPQQLILVDSFNEILESVIKEKYIKESIMNVYKERGAGILIVGCFSPFHYPVNENLEDLLNSINKIHSSNEKIFKEIYLYDYDYKPIKVV